MKLKTSIFWLGIIVAICVSMRSSAQLSVAATSTNYTVTFDANFPGVNYGGYTGTGVHAFGGPGRLNSNGWEILGMSDGAAPYGSNITSGDLARGTSSTPVSTGGIYSFFGGGISGRALAIQPTADDMTPGSVELRCVNNTGQKIHTVSLDYNLYYRNWGTNTPYDRSNSFNCTLRTENMGSYTDLPSGEVSPAALQFNSPGLRTNTSLVQVPFSYSFSGVAIEEGEYFYIRWDLNDETGGGDRDEFVLDDIIINVEARDSLVFYTQNTGVQTSGTGTTTTVEWSTVPAGNVTYKMFPFQDSSSLVVQNSHVVEYVGNGSGASFKNLVVEAGGQLRSDGNVITGIPRYLYLFGDITCDGEIGNGPGASVGTSISFNLEPGEHIIRGAPSGIFNCARIRKSANNAGPCTLDFNSDVGIHWPNNCLYSNRDNVDGGTNQFTINVNTGATVDISGYMGIDGDNPVTDFAASAGGTLNVYGTLNIAKEYYITTNNGNVLLPVNTNIHPNGIMAVQYLRADPSGNAGHNFTLYPNSLLNITGRRASGETWFNYSTTNNTIDIQPGNTIRYSMNNSQPVLQSIDYRNLILSGSGNKSVSPAAGDLRVHEDLDIRGASILRPNGMDIHCSGSWVNYAESGFAETGVTVLFDDASGSSTISCTIGTELFDDVIFDAGVIDLNTSIDVYGSLELNTRVNLNSNDVLIRVPANIVLGPTSDSFFVSEDILHQGTISVTVNSYTGPVDFPFGTESDIPIYARFTLNSGNAGIVQMATYGTPPDNTPWPVAPVLVNNLMSSMGLFPDNREATADRFWSITAANNTYDADLQLSLTSAEVPATPPYNTVANLVAQRYESSGDQWEFPLPGQTALSGTFSPSTVSVFIPNVTQLSPWAVASSNSPLPVELLKFEGQVTREGIKLDWTTATEINNSHFELRKFADDQNEIWLGEVQGNGNSSTELDYAFIDERPNYGWNYYRLIQHDNDGTQSDEGIVSVWWDGPEDQSDISVMWTQEGFQLSVSEEQLGAAYSIFDSSGKLIQSNKIISQPMLIRLPRARGFYILQVANGDQQFVKRLVDIRP